MRRHYDAYARHNWAATMWSYKLITSPGRKNTGGWWLITNTGQRKTGAWWIVTNQTPLPAPDFKTAEKDQIEAWFRSFSTVPYEINEPLRKALQAMDSPGPIETIAKETMTVPPATDALAGWTAIDINDPLPGGQKRISDSAIDLYAAGSDVYGTADQFRFVCQKLSGDFTISATLDYLTFTHVYAKAGHHDSPGSGKGLGLCVSADAPRRQRGIRDPCHKRSGRAGPDGDGSRTADSSEACPQRQCHRTAVRHAAEATGTSSTRLNLRA